MGCHLLVQAQRAAERKGGEVSLYRKLLKILEDAPPESWEHPFGCPFSWCRINGVEITLYRIGWINFANKIHEGWPTSWRGRKLFKKIRPRNMSYDYRSLVAQELEKLGAPR